MRYHSAALVGLSSYFYLRNEKKSLHFVGDSYPFSYVITMDIDILPEKLPKRKLKRRYDIKGYIDKKDLRVVVDSLKEKLGWEIGAEAKIYSGNFTIKRNKDVSETYLTVRTHGDSGKGDYYNWHSEQGDFSFNCTDYGTYGAFSLTCNGAHFRDEKHKDLSANDRKTKWVFDGQIRPL